jgi:FkbM family methyltransferase
LFGAGNLGRQTLACLREDGLKPIAFADNSPARWTKEIDGLDVLSPNEAAEKFGGNSTFLVTIWNDKQRFAETAEQLHGIGCPHVVASPSLRWKYRSRIPPFPFFFLDLPSRVYRSRSDILSASHVWGDDRSRREYLAQLRLRLWGDLLGLPAPEPNQYAPFDLFAPRDDEVFVDCGAFDGDTIQAFVTSWGGRFKAIHALEPDPSSCARLRGFVASLSQGISEKVQVREIAVGNESGVIRFKADGTMGAAVSDDGNVDVQCRTLDEALHGEDVSYIKMDIEGQEPAALRGALQLITTRRPVLAVCVYHEPEHLWSIPLLLAEVLPNYRFFLRPHRPDGWDLILYAVPNERCSLRS